MKSGKTEKNILLAGLPGNMAQLITDKIREKEEYNLLEIALTGDIPESEINEYHEKEGMELIPVNFHKGTINELKEKYGEGEGKELYAINFADANGYYLNEHFVENEIPFICGTTGISEEKESDLVKTVEESKIPAVIDKNMSPALVVLGEMLGYAGREFPGALKKYGGIGTESHQETKADPISGTLRKWSGYLEKLGIEFAIRDGARNIPAGHGDHYIRIRSPDSNLRIGLTTEVSGRDTYADGVVNYALPFLEKKWSNNNKEGRVYSMVDVLKNND